jgi:hypothetical protein
LWRQLLALAVAIAGATGAVVWALPRSRRTVAPPLAQGYMTLVRALAAAVAAGVFVAALLSRWSFMLAFNTFLGVKPAQVLPVVLVALWLAFQDQARAAGWRATLRGVGAWLNQPLRLGGAITALVVAGAAVLVLVRTGNVSLPLSGPEQQLRRLLEETLVARPRTKEFLFGYPVLVLAGTAAALEWRRLALVLAVAGTVGTAGAINSFSHLHTPFIYSLWRTGNALALGAAIAFPAAVVLLWVRRRLARS